MSLARFFGFGRPPAVELSAEERLAQASQLKLTWWRFRRHRLAVLSAVIVILFYLVAVFADFLAYSDPHDTDARRSYIPPQGLHLFDDGAFRPYIYGLKGTRDMRTFRITYQPDLSRKVYVHLFAEGYPYKLFGLIPTNRHLIGLVDPRPEDNIFLLGSDLLGRDLWSRLMVATRVSLTIGLCGVTLSLFLGVLLGGVSAIYGGAVDTAIQRLI